MISMSKQLPEKDPIQSNLNLVYIELYKASPEHVSSDSSNIKVTVISYETVYETHLLYLYLGLNLPNKRGISISDPISNQS